MRTAAVLFAVLVLGAARGVAGHHSFAAQYDADTQVTLAGTITKVEWTNPHTYFYLDVVDDAGKVVSWAVEGGAPNVLYREGWKPTSLKAGDRVTILGARAKNGSNQVNALSVRLPDGRCVFAGTSGPDGSATSDCTVGRR
ncbi:MAG: hypothetical protein FJW14_08120 [Acidimicrobiia bacterium]|nr:hypothetical protein [Acidimicrobiia bacterium]